MEKKSNFAFAAAAGAVSLYALAAFAQQQNNQSAQPSAPPAASAPSTAAPGAPAVSEPKNDTTAKPDSDDSGDGRGRGWRRRMGQGPDAGYAGPGMRGQGMQRGRMGQRWRNMSEADRKAFFEARIAAIRAGLMLNETQQRLWPAVEDAVRDMYAKRQAMAERIRKEGRPANPVDRMKRRGDMMAERGAALQKFANAARPLYDTLSDEQKRRLRMLTPGMQRMNRMRSNWRHGGMRGNRMQGHHGHHGRRFGQHHHNWGGR
ncbi:MAG: Spy/CpxP family protein refolding chaperone, partial [Beijerinckiaceae bacterium]